MVDSQIPWVLCDDDGHILAISAEKELLDIVRAVRMAYLPATSEKTFTVREACATDQQSLLVPFIHLKSPADLKQMPEDFDWFERYTKAETACALLNLPMAPDTIKKALDAYDAGLLNGLMKDRTVYVLEIDTKFHHPEPASWELLPSLIAVHDPADIGQVIKEYNDTRSGWNIEDGEIRRVELILKPAKLPPPKGPVRGK